MPPDCPTWDEALSLLGEVLESRGAAPCHLVVCGGAALRAMGVISRVTRDVDVLASRAEVDGEIGGAWPLPERLKVAAAEVAVELGLPSNWLNASTSLLIGPLDELPAELWSDLREVGYGPRLRISYLVRAGLLLLKFHAALGRDERRDLEDLVALAPTGEECRRVLRWLRGTGAIDAARPQRLDKILNLLGHGHD